MSFDSVSFVPPSSASPTTAIFPKKGDTSTDDTQSTELKQAFQDFVGQTFFAEMIKAMRTAQEPAKYFNGGQAEKIFQGQFDQKLAEELSQSSANQIADPMFKLFQLRRQ